VPATALYIAQGTRNDDRLTEAVQLAHSRSIPLIEVPRIELDSMTGNGLHQGVGLQIPPFEYADVFDLIGTVADSKEQGMIVVLDNITDPRNLGAVIRSTAAFGGQGVVIPERRSASVTAVAWRTSAGTAARSRRRVRLSSREATWRIEPDRRPETDSSGAPSRTANTSADSSVACL